MGESSETNLATAEVGSWHILRYADLHFLWHHLLLTIIVCLIPELTDDDGVALRVQYAN